LKPLPSTIFWSVLLYARVLLADSVVVFNEVMFHPLTNESQLEWVELQNQLGVDVDISGWSLTGGVEFKFAEGTVIPMRGFAVVALSPTTFSAVNGSTNVLGPFTGRLSNAGDTLQLRNRDGRVMDKITYGVEGDWPVAPDGAGPSLARRKDNVQGSDPKNWRASAQMGGTPGAENFPPASAVVLRNTLLPLSGAWKFNDTGVDLGTNWRATNFNDAGWSSGAGVFFHGPITALPTNTALAPGRTTYYFRTQFVFTGGVDRVQLALRAALDDGAFAYLNGAEIYRFNMPTGAVTYSTLALAQVGNASLGPLVTLTSEQLRQGTNVFAVEVHQAGSSIGYPQTVLNSGPVGYWRLGEAGGTAADSASLPNAPQSGAQNGVYQNFLPANLAQPGPRPTDTINGQPLLGFDASNTAPRFAGNADGGNDVVRIPDPGALNFSSGRQFTLEAWVKAPVAQEDFSGIICKGEGGVSEEYCIEYVSSSYRFFLRNSGGGGFEMTPPNVPANNTWQHIAGTYNGALGLMKFYLNGVERSSDSTAPTQLFSNTRDVTIGSRQLSNGPENLNFDGWIDEVAIYNRALPASEILAHFNAAFTSSSASGVDTNDAAFGLELISTEVLPEPSVSFNELSSSTNSAFWLELINSGTGDVDLGGYVIARLGGTTNREYMLPAQTLSPGALLQVTKAQMGFGADSGDRLVLYTPGKLRVADAVVAKKEARGRSPDGSGAWWFPDEATPGASNHFTFHSELVINEIMYHHPELVPFADSPESWIEIFNRSSNSVNLTGWRLDEGIDYRFATGKTIAPGSYLIVAKDVAQMQALHPGVEVVGPFTNKLSKRGDYIVLKDADNNPADEVRYFDGGDWPEYADGGGSSLELRDPRADNSQAGEWAASDESGKSTWQTFTWRGLAQPGQTGEPELWHELAMCLLDGAGEAFIDDVHVIETPSTTPKELIWNSGFNGGSKAHWKFLGNHRRTRVETEPGNPSNFVLHLIATGPGEYQGNQIETTLTNNSAIVNGREYEISFRAKWLAGKAKLNTRLYFNRLARTVDLIRPVQLGTPGAVNSRYTPNIGPTFHSLLHTPVIPDVGQPVNVSVAAYDPDQIGAMMLKYSVAGGAWQSAAMVFSNSTARFHANVPGQNAGALVQFYVEGADSLGAVSRFPAGGTNSRALFVVQDQQAAPAPRRNLRILMTSADVNLLHADTNHQSNELLGSTVVSDESEVYYDVGVRLKGSLVGRESERAGYHLTFAPAQFFRGVHETVGADRSRNHFVGDIGEIVAKHMANHAGGIPNTYDDLVHLIAPLPIFTTSSELRLAGYDEDYLDGQYKNGSDGPMFEVEGIRWFTQTNSPEGLKPTDSWYANLDMQDYGNAKESYRWYYLASHNRTADDYEGCMAFSKVFSLSGANFDAAAPGVMDVDQWLRCMAYLSLLGGVDLVYSSAAVHNFRIYVRPEDQRMLFMPWDSDSTFLGDYSASLIGFGNVAKLVSSPQNLRIFYNHMFDIINTSFNVSYMAPWIAHYNAVGGMNVGVIQGYISARRNFALGQLPTSTPFAITSNGGNNFATNDAFATLTGTAPISVRTIEVNGVAYPVTWTSTTQWRIVVPLFAVTNLLLVQGVDNYGQRNLNASDSITITNTGSIAAARVVINEWMADNTGPNGFVDPVDGAFQDWFELFNPNSNAVNLSGFTLTDNLTQPAKWRIPTNTLISARGFLLVWADNQTNQNGTSSNGHLHAAFQLNNGGESIGLFAPDGTLQSSVTFGEQMENVSQGMFPDGNTNGLYFMTNSTPRFPNTLAGPLRVTEIKLNGDNLTLSWVSLPQHRYQVQHKRGLSDSLWNALGTEIQATNETTSVIYSVGTNVHGIFRIWRVE
jgi:hypothetical protein